MTYQLKKLYPRYFQKSRSFLAPVLGLKKASKFPFEQCYMQWEGKYTVKDQRIILTFDNPHDDPSWQEYQLESLVHNPMFDEIHDIGDGMVAMSFDLHCIEEDYMKVLEGKYGKLSLLVKNKIRDFYGYSSAEWVYMESFLFPDKYIRLYSEMLAVDEEHIRFTGELCDLPDLEKETLKTRKHAKINDAYPLLLEQREDLQDDSSGDRLPI